MTAEAPATSRRTQKIHRPEIEGLRAVAAFLVAIWHIWVGGVSGGVDVFFVVSGLLITTTLLGQLDRFGRVRPLMFVGRLLRRLLPQALVVLLAVFAGVWLLLPEVLRERALREIFASALYFENWQLASSAVDYLDAEDPHTPVQHFWAMSVQGQFYVLWAVLFLVGFAIAAGRAGRARKVVFGLLVAVAAVSFAYSVWFTAENQPVAYFSTFARAWEFAIGAIVAYVIMRVKLPRPAAFAVGWIGLIGVVSCAVVLDVDEQFPGAVALWPVVAAMLVLFAGTEREAVGHAPWLLSRKPLVWLGGISYGIYLWHFPLVIFFRHVTGSHDIGVLPGVAILVASVVLAWGTTRLVERPIRAFGDRTARTKLIAAGLLVAVAVGTAGATVAARDALAGAASADQERALEQIAQDDRAAECFGANAMVVGLDECADATDPDLLVPARGELLEDTAYAYSCYTPAEAVDPQTCTYGSERDDALRVAVIGNSHAAMYTAALRTVGEDINWRIDTFVGNRCVWGEGHTDPPCDTRTPQNEERLLGGEPYDVVLYTTGRGDREYSQERVDQYLESWGRLADAGTQVIAIEDNPRLTEEATACVVEASREALADGACDVPRETALASPDMVAEAARRSGGSVPLVEMTDMFCTDELCPATIGNVIVYRDQHHLTGTYILSMTPYIVERVETALAEAE